MPHALTGAPLPALLQHYAGSAAQAAAGDGGGGGGKTAATSNPHDPDDDEDEEEGGANEEDEEWEDTDTGSPRRRTRKRGVQAGGARKRGGGGGGGGSGSSSRGRNQDESQKVRNDAWLAACTQLQLGRVPPVPSHGLGLRAKHWAACSCEFGLCARGKVLALWGVPHQAAGYVLELLCTVLRLPARRT